MVDDAARSPAGRGAILSMQIGLPLVLVFPAALWLIEAAHSPMQRAMYAHPAMTLTPWAAYVLLGVALLALSPSVGAGYTVFTAGAAAAGLVAGALLSSVFVGVGWGASGPQPWERALMGCAIAGAVLSIVLFVISLRYCLRLLRARDWQRPLIGCVIAVIAARIVTTFLMYANR